MALSSRIKVPLPGANIIVRGTGKYPYVYKVISTFRNEKGAPDNTRVSIGKLDKESGMLLPNDKYWEIYGDTVLSQELVILDPGKPFEVRSIGAVFLVGRILESLGITEILSEKFGAGKASAITTAAIYMLCRGNIFEHVSEWHNNYTYKEAPLSSPGSSSLFSSITFEERMEFFRRWVSLQADNEYFVYDVTSFSSYAAGINETEWGYNRDKEKLPQINFGCYLGQQSGLPVFYVTYPGSIVDKSHLKYMMAYNGTLGIRNTCFVMDKGFCSTSNVEYMHSEKLSYIMGVDMSHKTTRSAIDSVRHGLISMRNLVNNTNSYARSVHGRFYGRTSKMHVFFDPNLAECQRRDLYRLVESQDETLCQLEQLTKQQAKRYQKYFEIILEKDGTFEYRRDYEKIDNAAMNNGFFCLLTNTETNSAEVLSTYKRKDVIEKGFDDLKNHIDMKRLRTHSINTTDGKMFCAFISLIAALEMVNRLSPFMKKKSMSKDAVIKELEKIKIVFIDNGNRIMNPLTKTQRTILETCGFKEDDLTHYLNG